MNFHKHISLTLAAITLFLSVYVVLKTEPGVKELKRSNIMNVIYYDPKYRAYVFLYNSGIALSVISGLLLVTLFGEYLHSGYSNTKIYKIIKGILTAATLVLSALVIYFTTDTVITDPDADVVITPADGSNEPMGKNKPYFASGISAGVLGILLVGSIWITANNII